MFLWQKRYLHWGMALIICLGMFVCCETSQDTKIREDYLAFMKVQGETELTLRAIKILNKYGTYNSAVVVRMERGAYHMITTIEVGGIEFTFGDTNIA